MTLRERLSILPEVIEHDDGTETDIPQRWWNWHREWYGPSQRVVVGDLVADTEHEHGELMGLAFSAELYLFENSGQFDNEGWLTGRIKTRPRKFEDHSFSAIVGRWGIYIAWRGKEITI